MNALLYIPFLIQAIVSFSLPDLTVDTEVSLDQSQQLHDSIVNSSVKSFEFHFNLSTVSLGFTSLVLILFVLVARRQNSSISELGKRILQQEIILKKLRQNV